MTWTVLKWLREAGILLLTISLLFLPWYLDPAPETGQSPFITGVEFLAAGSPLLIIGYGLALLAYVISRFTTRQWAGVLLLVTAAMAYWFLHLGATVSLPDAGVDRPSSSLETMLVETLVGARVNFLALLVLAVGFYAAFPRDER